MKIDVHALPAIFPFRVSEEASQNFGIKVALAFEVAVESSGA
jgi:hypothetical protein